MNITKTVREHLEGLVPRDETSMIVILMDLYGLTGQQIADAVGRSQSQVAVYRAGSTPMPAGVKKALRSLLIEAQNIAVRADIDFELIESIIETTDMVLEKWA